MPALACARRSFSGIGVAELDGVPYIARANVHRTALDHTSPSRMTTSVARRPPARPDPAAPDEVREAFRSLHAERLHGFAVLLTLGDRKLAAYLAAEALAAGAQQHDELRHPERAAAWLRARVLRHLRPERSPKLDEARRATLAALGVAERASTALALLTPRERAGLIAEHVEALEPLDVATVIDRDGQRLTRLLARARARYASAFAREAEAASPPDDGPLAARVRAIADHAMT
jgi:DNA-directed RNA polymerase specialized sigma24 family protein